MAGRFAKTALFLGAVAVAGVLALGWREDRAASAPAPVAATATTPAATELASPEILRVEPRDLARAVRFSGSTRAARRERIDAEVGGRLAEVNVEIGDGVEEGALIARIDTAQLASTLQARQATLAAREAQRDYARTTLERARRLGTAGISTEAALLSAEADLRAFEAQVQALQADVADAERALADAEIRAPFDGTIAARSVDAGQTVSAGTALFEVVNLDAMEVDALIPTSRIADVRLGQTATLRVEGMSDRPLAARVLRIAPAAEEGTRAVRVILRVEDPDRLLRGGMFATGEIETERLVGVIALPAAALRRDEAGTFVLKAEDGHVRRQAVREGARFPEGDLVEIASGLTSGDVVVTAPLPDLRPDTAITIADLG